MAAPLVAAAAVAAKAAGAKIGAAIAAKGGTAAAVKTVTSKTGAKILVKKAATKPGIGLASKAGSYNKPIANIAQNQTQASAIKKPQPITKTKIEQFKERKAREVLEDQLEKKHDSEDQDLDTDASGKSSPADSKKENKSSFNFIMAIALIKDFLEILLTLSIVGTLVTNIVSFPFTVILTIYLFASGQRGMFKIVAYFISIMTDQFAPGIVSFLPIASIATYLTFKGPPKILKSLNKDASNKILNISKKFLKK